MDFNFPMNVIFLTRSTFPENLKNEQLVIVSSESLYVFLVWNLKRPENKNMIIYLVQLATNVGTIKWIT